jgi:phosphoesterase RecJ-like protein
MPERFSKPRPQVVDRILEAVEQSRSVCVVGHVRPDGDCVGSQLALGLALQTAGKEVSVWNEDPAPTKLKFLDPDGLFSSPAPGRSFDCVIATDVANLERVGRVGECIQDRRVFINIDHHASNTRFGDINWVSRRESSTGELIHKLLRYAGWPITPRIADCLFTAISTDTGSFQYASTRPSTFAIAGELVKRGADLGRVCQEVYHSYPLARMRLLRHVYMNFRLVADDRIAYFWLRPADFARTGSTRADTEGLIDHIRAIEPVVVACVFEEIEPGTVRVSLRSKSDRVDVNRVAALFGGGGHAAAAGARVVGTPLGVQRRVLNALKKALNPPA